MGSLIAPKGETEFKRQLVSTWLQEVVCFSIVDLGSQDIKREGETRLQRKVQITFETQERWKFTNKDTWEEVEKPLIIWNRYTLSTHEKSGLFKMLKWWIGKAPSDDFDIMEMVGKPALINIIESEGKDWKIYHNIDSVLPSKQKPFKLFNKEVRFSLQEFEKEEFDKLYEWQQKIIHKSPEMKKIMDSNKWNDILDDDLPF